MNSYYGLTHDKVSAYLKAAGWQQLEWPNPAVECWETIVLDGKAMHISLQTDPTHVYYSKSIDRALVIASEVNERRAEIWKDLLGHIDMIAYLSRN